jgi:hypothetical protein
MDFEFGLRHPKFRGNLVELKFRSARIGAHRKSSAFRPERIQVFSRIKGLPAHFGQVQS